MSTPDLHHLEQLLEKWESLPESERSTWLNDLRSTDESVWRVFTKMIRPASNTRVASISQRLWSSLDLEEERVGQSIQQFTIRNVVDGGGMGIVYQAWDRRLNRMVALKFLRKDDLDKENAVDRFIQEARASAALDHPNICGIFEVEKAPDGAPFFAMPWYDGHTVAELLEQGPLPPDLSRSVLSQTAQGLHHAHEHGLIHCDIKPGNLFVTTEGRVKILDFGIAQLMESRGSAALGPIMGTLPYMSPERLEGHPSSVQSDLWSLGVVGFEMLTGNKPFSGAEREELQQKIHGGPGKLPGHTPIDLRRAVEILLMHDPDKRPDSAQWVSRILEQSPDSNRWSRRVSVAVVLLLVVWGLSRPWMTAETAPIVEIEPFSITQTTVDSTLAAGLFESIILRAGQLPGVEIRRGTPRFDGSAEEVEVATWRLHGSFDSDNRLTLLLEDVDLTEPIWQSSLPVDTASWAGLDQTVVDQLRIRLEVEQELDSQVAQSRPLAVNEAAFKHYLRGLNLLSQRTPAQLESAIFEFHEATAHDPEFSAAYASLAQALALDASSGYSSAQGTTGMMQAEIAAERALDLDPENPTAHFTKAFILHEYHWDWNAAALHFEEALALNPSNAEALHLYATHLAELGEVEKALIMQNRARTLSPRTPIYHANYAQLLFLDRRFEEVLEFLDRLEPVLAEFYIARIWQSWALIETGRLDDATRHVAQLRSDLGPQPLVQCLEGILLARLGQTDASLELASRIEPSSPTLAAAVLLEHGDVDEALTLLEHGVDIRDAYVTTIGAWPGTDPVRGHPRFEVVLERMNLGGE